MKSVDDLTSRLMALMFFFCFSVFFLGGGRLSFILSPKRKNRNSPKFSDFFRKIVLQSMSFWIHGVFLGVHDFCVLGCGKFLQKR